MLYATRLPIAAVLLAVLTASAAAQILGPGMPRPGGGPPVGGFPMPGQAPQQQQMPPCMQQFMPLRQEAEKRATVLKAAMQKKVPREEACTLIKSFAQAEAKLVKFVTDNQQSCGIPPQVPGQLKQNHSRTLASQHQVCDAAAAGTARATGPRLTEALVTSRMPGRGLDRTAPRSGTLDTMTGNVLAR